MRIFNRVVMVLLLAGLIVLGAYMVVYGLGLFGYQLSNLPSALNLTGFYGGLRGFVGGVQSGSLPFLAVFIMVAIAIIGLILLIAELKPSRPRKVRMQRGTHVTRGVVENEVATAAGRTPDVLDSRARVRARRRPGADVNLRASVRRGEDVRSIRSNLRNSVQEHLARTGVPLGRLKVKLNESDPRQTQTRVQ